MLELSTEPARPGDLKSGMPDSTEIPAPVKAVIEPACIRRHADMLQGGNITPHTAIARSCPAAAIASAAAFNDSSSEYFSLQGWVPTCSRAQQNFGSTCSVRPSGICDHMIGSAKDVPHGTALAGVPLSQKVLP